MICSPTITHFAPRTNYPMKMPFAIRIVSVLMSPDFLYRLDLSDGGTRFVCAPRCATLVQLCSREPVELFLWASMPDDELLRHAALGRSAKAGCFAGANPPHVERSRACAAWPPNSPATGSVSANSKPIIPLTARAFPTFNNDLREAMFQEPIRFVEDIDRAMTVPCSILFTAITRL